MAASRSTPAWEPVGDEQFVRALLNDATTAPEGLGRCTSSIEAIAVEPAWMAARAPASCDVGAGRLGVGPDASAP